jgi:hypothetical protein
MSSTRKQKSVIGGSPKAMVHTFENLCSFREHTILQQLASPKKQQVEDGRDRVVEQRPLGSVSPDSV